MDKTIITVTGIRPDFIRMSEVFRKLDENFNHILVHTGQHYDELLSDVFFKELKIREPDFNLAIGAWCREHFHQTGLLDTRLIELIRKEKINPDLILFLGDSNSVVSSVSLRKEGYKIGHIEAGMRSGDKRMLEEINRTVCDHCSDYHFVYHEDYKSNLIKENLPEENIFVVGNTIVEVCNKINIDGVKSKNQILLDIHRPENFKYPIRLQNILDYANLCASTYETPVKMLKFGRTMREVKGLNLGEIQLIDLMSYKDFLTAQYDSLFIISDSGTAQEEPALLKTPVIVPRDYTERPQSVTYSCSFMLDINTINNKTWKESYNWLDADPEIETSWLGEGKTSEKIIEIIKEKV